MSANYPAISKNNDSQNAIDVPVDTTAFNSKLSASDIDVQTALETLDDHTHDLVSLVTTSLSESIDVTDLSKHHIITQDTTNITTTLTVATGSKVTVSNKSGGDCYIGNVINGDSSPVLIYNQESFTMIYDGTELVLV